MKKILYVIMTFLIAFSVAGCAGSSPLKVSSEGLVTSKSTDAESSKAEASDLEDTSSENFHDKLEEICDFANHDVWNAGFTIIWSCSASEKNQDESVIKIIDDTLNKLKDTMNKKGEYDKYIESLQDSKYDKLKRVWRKFSTQADLMYKEVDGNKLAIKDQPLDFTSLDIMEQDLTDFKNEAENLLKSSEAVSSQAKSAEAKPEDVVKGYFEAAKLMDTAAMNKFLDVKQDEHIANSEYEKVFYDYIKGNAKKVTYTIEESKVTGSTATVTVDCKFVDGSKFFEETIMEYAKKAKEFAANGKQPTEEEAKNELKKTMTEKQKTVKETFAEKTVKILCVKIRGKWYIDMTGYDVDNVFASNLIDFSVEFPSRVSSN